MDEKMILSGKCNMDFLLQALDSVQEGITIIDRDGVVRYANQGAAQIMGVLREELIDEKVDRLTTGTPLLVQILEKKEPILDIEYFLDFKGRAVHLINSGYPIIDEQGEVVGAIDIFRGIQRSLKLANTIAGHSASFTFDQIIGDSSNLRAAVKLAKAYSRSDENVLICGDSGTGKELFAQSIHNYSKRNSQPFIALNCANFPNDLIDSELFGYEEGAFTGAAKKGKIGKFEAADGGTLFLDEIGEMPIHLQAKLLRVIETQTLQRIGSTKAVQIDVKIIAATNRDLPAMVCEGHFRNDLYYRLKVLDLNVPSLAERGNDVLLLAEYFLGKMNRKMSSRARRLSAEAKQLLLEHSWPGNVRELENVIARAMVSCDEEWISAEVLQEAGVGQAIRSIRKSPRLDAVQAREMLRQMAGNKKRTAEALGISRPTLYKLLKQL